MEPQPNPNQPNQPRQQDSDQQPSSTNQPHSQQDQSNQPPDFQQVQPTYVSFVEQPLKTLLTWEAPARPFKKRQREFYTTAGSIIFLICVILLFIKEFILIMVLIALAFFIYVLSTVKPEKIKHTITNKGIETMGKKFSWDMLGRFWFDEKWNYKILYIENFYGFPTRLMMLLGEQSQQEIEDILNNFLINEVPEKTQMEKAGQWLQEKIPLETDPKTADNHSKSASSSSDSQSKSPSQPSKKTSASKK